MYNYDIKQFFQENESVVMTKSVFVPNSLVEHTHNYLEIAYITEGIGYHLLNGTKYKIKKGDVFFISKGSVHNYEAITSSFSWINCMFLTEAFHADTVNINNADDVLKLSVFSNLFEFIKLETTDVEASEKQNEFETLFSDMLGEYEKKDIGYQEVLSNYLNILLIRLFRGFSERNSFYEKENNYVDLVIEYLNNHKSENFKIEDVARKAFVSPKYFQRLFKLQTGMGLTAYLHQERIKNACSLLETTDLSVIQIMNEVGYQDAKFFYTIFKRHTGLTPGEYKKNLKP